MAINGAASNVIDEGRLLTYLQDLIPDITHINAHQFQGGLSNPTYHLNTSAGSFVLRKKPNGQLLPSAHQIEREYRVLSALQSQNVPVPRPILLCEDPSVIGTVFYVMEYVEGLVFHDPALPHLSALQRREICASMCNTIAAIHSVDWVAAGLTDFGRPDKFLARQIDRWASQYRAAVLHEPDPLVDALIAWLNETIPVSSGASIVHGDFRLGNVLFSKNLSGIAAVLDWELSTLGDPLTDLAYCCLPYHLPPEAGGIMGLDVGNTKDTGFPAEEELVEAYCYRMGLSNIPHWHFYLVFSLFRRIAILQGVFARAVRGNASDDRAYEFGDRIRPLVQAAERIAFGSKKVAIGDRF